MDLKDLMHYLYGFSDIFYSLLIKFIIHQEMIFVNIIHLEKYIYSLECLFHFVYLYVIKFYLQH